jgi:hypothetical protein
MTVFVAIEASQPDGAPYRLAIKCDMHLPSLWVVLTRLF